MNRVEVMVQFHLLLNQQITSSRMDNETRDMQGTFLFACMILTANNRIENIGAISGRK